MAGIKGLARRFWKWLTERPNYAGGNYGGGA